MREALKRADVAIEAIKIPCLADIDATLAVITARFSSTAPDRASEPLEDLYGLAMRIIDVSICLEGSGIDHAARALCDLVDLSDILGVCDWEAIDLHINTIKLLRTHGLSMTDVERGKLLLGLAKVTRKRVGDPNAAPSEPTDGVGLDVDSASS